MQTQSCFRTYASGVILIGCMLAFISAVIPHYTAGYHLMLSVLLSGLLPYLIYVLAVPFLDGWRLALPGTVLLILHGWLVVRERFLNDADYNNGMIYYVPLILASLLLPLIIRALREPWGADAERPASPDEKESSLG